MSQSASAILLIPGGVILLATYFVWRTIMAEQGSKVSLGILFWVVILTPVALSIALSWSSHSILVFQGKAIDHNGFTVKKCHYFNGRSIVAKEFMRLECPNWVPS